MKNKKIIALGADIKNRILSFDGKTLQFGADISDLSRTENFARFKNEVGKALQRVVVPDIIACDLHPAYFSTIFAREFVELETGTALVQVQHHHAHVASVVAEHSLKGPVIGVAFDGTGYGLDGNMWGGEFFVMKNMHFARRAHFKYRMMPGGDAVVTEPWRMAVSIMKEEAFPFLKNVDLKSVDHILTMMGKKVNCPLSSSVGRIFDAAAALIVGICRAKTEAEGPVKLSNLCDRDITTSYEFTIDKQRDSYIIDTDKTFKGILRDLASGGMDESAIATRFHNTIAHIVISVVERISGETGITAVALSGGVFQNKFLKVRIISGLRERGFAVYRNDSYPINDLNISMGQYYVSSRTRQG